MGWVGLGYKIICLGWVRSSPMSKISNKYTIYMYFFARSYTIRQADFDTPLDTFLRCAVKL